MPGSREGHDTTPTLKVIKTLETVTITSPAAKTVKVQLEAIMEVVNALAEQGQRRASSENAPDTKAGAKFFMMSVDAIHPQVWELLKEAGITNEDALQTPSYFRRDVSRRDAPVRLVW